MSSHPVAQEGSDSGIGSLPRELWILLIGSFIIAVGMGIVAPVLPTFAASFDVGFAAASFVVSAFALMRLLFAPVSGRLISWFGERPIYVVGITIVGISTTACAFAGTYWQLVVFRGLGGIGSTMFTVSALALLIRLAPPRLRGRASGLWATSFLLGGISGPIVGGLLVGYSYRLPFLSYGAALFIAAFLGWLLLRHSTLAARDTDRDVPSMNVMHALRHRAYRAALASNFSIGWAVHGVRVALVPLFVAEVLRSGQALAGAALSVFALGNAAVLLISGRLADRRGRKPMMLLGLIVSALGTASLGFTDSAPLFLTASLVAGVGAGFINPAQSASVADIVGSKGKGGPVLAAFQMASDVGAILGPLFAGMLADALSFQAAFLVTGLVLILALLFWLRAPETRSASEPAA